jgi:hypothetical protein
MAPGRFVLLVAVLVTLTSACGVAHPGDLSYRTDKRLHFLAPKARTVVKTPIDVRWSISDFTVQAPGSAPASEKAGYFAVFVDRAPIKPKETMRVVAKRDEVCLHRPGCPDESYLEDRRIYTTTSYGLTLEQIPPIAGDTERIQLHQITVILMDTTGHRIGESAWQLDVRMRRVGL